MNPSHKIAAIALIAAFGTLTSTASASTVSLAITNTLEDIVGSTAVITGSGSTANTTDWADGDRARFEMTEGGTGTMFGLEVTPVAWSGSFGPGAGRDNLMIARTVDSQGLTDTGTLSFYMRPDSNQAYTATMRLSLFDVGFTTAMPLNLTVTSLDIDFNQQMRIPAASISSYGLSSATDIVVSQSGPDLVFRGPGSASFDDEEAAVSLTYVDTSTFDITFAHSSVALYMLEFRTPPTVIEDDDFTTVSPVPLPAPALMLLAALGGLGAMRARARRKGV